MKATDLVSRLRALGDPTIAAHSQRFFKTGPGEYAEGDRFLGVRVPVLRAELKHHRELPLRENITLLQSPFHEARLLALLMLVDRFRRGDAVLKATLYRHYLAEAQKIADQLRLQQCYRYVAIKYCRTI